MRPSITAALAAHAPVDAPATWVLSNHDVTRPVTRYGRADTAFAFESKRVGTPTDIARGTRRARAAALLAMALPGSMYIYQGEELGLPEVEDIPDDRRQDPMWLRSGGVDPGRDGCRVPLPWAGTRPPYGFSRDGAAAPWLDQPGRLGAAHRRGRVRATRPRCSRSTAPACALRRADPWCGRRRSALAASDPTCWPSPAASASPASSTSAGTGRAAGRRHVLIASDELEGGALPQDTTVWLRRPSSPDTPGTVDSDRHRRPLPPPGQTKE